MDRHKTSLCDELSQFCHLSVSQKAPERENSPLHHRRVELTQAIFCLSLRHQANTQTKAGAPHLAGLRIVVLAWRLSSEEARRAEGRRRSPALRRLLSSSCRQHGQQGGGTSKTGGPAAQQLVWLRSPGAILCPWSGTIHHLWPRQKFIEL